MILEEEEVMKSVITIVLILGLASCTKRAQVGAVAVNRDEMLADLADDIWYGRLEASVNHFADQERARAVLNKLSEQQRSDLAGSFRKARLVTVYPNGRAAAYKAPFKESDGSINQVEFTLGRLESGHWIITNW